MSFKVNWNIRDIMIFTVIQYLNFLKSYMRHIILIEVFIIIIIIINLTKVLFDKIK